MSFETFQHLPNYDLQIPRFTPVNIPPPPVYNTTETIAPLLHLAEYLSPDARALRKAVVAKANFEYRAYTSGNPKAFLDPQFYLRLRAMQRQDQLRQLQMDALRRKQPSNLLPPEVMDGQKHFGITPNAYVPPDPTTDSTPPPSGESELGIPDVPGSSIESEL